MVLRAAGVASYGCCVVCLGSDNMQESILVTLTLKELGIPKIVARASSEQHRKGATRSARIWSCSPRRIWAETGVYAGQTDVFEFINFSKDHSIVELKTPRRWAGKAIKDLDVRKRYGVNIIAISKAGSATTLKSSPTPTVCSRRRRRWLSSAATRRSKKLPESKNNLAICANSGIIKV